MSSNDHGAVPPPSPMADDLVVVHGVVVTRAELLATHVPDESGAQCRGCGHIYGDGPVVCPVAAEASEGAVALRLAGSFEAGLEPVVHLAPPVRRKRRRPGVLPRWVLVLSAVVVIVLGLTVSVVVQPHLGGASRGLLVALVSLANVLSALVIVDEWRMRDRRGADYLEPLV